MSNVLHRPRRGQVRRLVRWLPAALLVAAFLPAAVPAPAAAGGGPFASFAASATDVAVGAAVTLTTVTTFDVGPTPYWTQIYDVGTNTRVAVCASGTVCTATVSRSTPAFGRFQAWVAPLSATAPPPAGAGSSIEVDVAWNAIDVSLSPGSATTLSPTTYAFNLTAVAAVNVGPTPYWIEIFDVTTGAEVGACGSGTTCTQQTVLPVGPVFTFQAFVTNFTTQVPTAFQGASAYVSTGGKG